MGELAIWAMGADREAIAKQEAAMTVLKATRASGNGEGRRYGPTAATDTAGARRLRAAPGSEGQEGTRREDGPSGGGRRRWLEATTDGDS